MSELIIINPTKREEKETFKLRVAAYVRVSSDSEEQENSFVVQYDYYTNLINNNPDWIFADIYADNGITGTEMNKRDDFVRMLEDCRLGKIDLVITKSISRFARNTYDSITTIRELKCMGVDIIFEKEGINTRFMKGETEITALSSMAQTESMSLSQNVRMGIKSRMRRGTFKQGCLPYGFKNGADGWNIVENEARIVRVVFNAYLTGKSLKKIADELNKAGISKKDGTINWLDKTIIYMITNPRYKGDALLQKTYTEEFPFKSKINHGEMDMYYVKNANPPIVSSETYDKVNRLLDIKRKQYCPPKTYVKRTLSKMIYCKECRTMFRRKSGETSVWVCRERDGGKEKCPTPQIAEEAIKKGFTEVYNRLVNNVEYVLSPMLNYLKEFREMKLSMQDEIKNINEKIIQATEQTLVINQLHAEGMLESTKFMQQKNDLNAEIIRLGKEKKLLTGGDECRKTIMQTERLTALIKQHGPIAEFDENIFGQIVKKVWVDKDRNISYELINNMKLEIEYAEVK